MGPSLSQEGLYWEPWRALQRKDKICLRLLTGSFGRPVENRLCVGQGQKQGDRFGGGHPSVPDVSSPTAPPAHDPLPGTEQALSRCLLVLNGVGIRGFQTLGAL